MTTTTNERQEAAATCTEPVVLCPAPPGSGKTATLVRRVQWLLDTGADPAGVCAITFTQAGARAMAERLPYRLGHCGTLHALALELLNHSGSSVGLDGRVSALDEDGAARLMAFTLDDLRVAKFTEDEVDVAVRDTRPFNGRDPKRMWLDKVHVVAVEYHRRQREQCELDFDSVLTYGLELLRRHDLSRTRFRHLLVDEFQDSAEWDFQFYRALECQTKFFCGDPDQAIYGFRGGRLANMLELAQTAAVRPLEVNYRSGAAIVEASRRLVRHNACRIDHLVTARPDAPPSTVEVVESDNPSQELAKLNQATTRTGSLAFLYRNNAQADEARDYLRSLGVKVQEKGKSRTFPAGQAALALLTNPFNESAARRLVVAQHQKEVIDWAALAGTSVAQQLKLPADLSTQPFDPWYFAPFRTLVESCRAFDPKTAQWLVELAAVVAEPFKLTDLASAAVEQTTDMEGAGVFVGTVHSAKGLEFDRVWLCGVEERFYPGRDEVEESRRLLYVGMTRARDELVLSWVKARPAPGRPWLTESSAPSPFVAEVAP